LQLLKINPYKEEITMTNFIKKLTGGSSNKDQGGCCGVEIKEVATEAKEEAADSCCSTSSSDNQSSCC
jgi:hypothetical protein